MPLHSIYKITQTVYEDKIIVVYRAIYLKENNPVILKMLKPSARSEHNLSQFSNEEKILSKLQSDNICELMDVITTPTEKIHVFNDIGGDSIYKLITDKTFSLLESIDIAVKITEAIIYLHKKNIVHADINPKNIIYNIDTKELQLIDFGYSILTTDALYDSKFYAGSVGNLLYMSPEQIGVTKNKIDYRSDFYSLGMSLYHLFLGRPPFDGEQDQQQLLHKQIALTPNELHSQDDKIPLVISKIISKLIQKNPNTRYQRDEAVLYDLQEVQKNIDSHNNIEDFDIATKDQPKIDIDSHLFGRDNEILILKQAYEKIKAQEPITLMISGDSGVGKTRLAEEFFSYFDTTDTAIVKGVFNQYKSNLSYSIFREFFNQLYTVLLSKNTILEHKKHLQHLKILSYFFPELKDVIPIKKDQEYSLEEIEAQLPSAFKEFLNYFTQQNNSIILFIDNIQWADQASVKLMQKTLLQIENSNIHIVLTYRTKEIKDNFNATKLIESFYLSKFYPVEIQLQNLNKVAIKGLLKTVLRLEEKHTKELVPIIYKKTGGNPFYIKNFIQYLVDKKDIYYQDGKWKYHLEKIKNYNASINIVKIMNSKFNQLSEQEKEYLRYLSILGDKQDINFTFEIMSALKQSNSNMINLKSNGFIEYSRGQYKFVHDQIHHFIYSNIDKELKRKIHYNIGLYLEKLYKKNLYIDIINLTYHLNNAYGKNKVPKKMFDLNIKAVKEMLKNGSYSVALKQLEWVEKNIFMPQMWSKKHLLVFEYKILRVKALYLNGFHEKAHDEITKLLKLTKKIEEQIVCFSILKDIFVTQGSNFYEGIKVGTTLLKKLHLNAPISKNEKNKAVQSLNSTISNHHILKEPKKIINLKQITDKTKKETISILVDFWELCYYLADIELMQWSYLNIILYSFNYGNSSESSFGYVLYGSHLVSQKKYKEAKLFGDIALKLNKKLQDKKTLPKICNFVANFINPYTKPVSTNITLYKQSLTQSKLNGDIIFGVWANFLMHFSDFLSGNSLESFQKNVGKYSSFILDSSDKKMIYIFQILKQSVQELREISDENRISINEEDAVKLWESEKFYPGLAWYGILKAQHSFLDAKFDEGLEYLNKYTLSTANEVIMFPKIRLHFIRILLLLNKKEALNKKEKIVLDEDLKEYESYIKTSPSLFRFEKILIKAEKMKSSASIWDSAKEYDAALKEAKKKNNPFYFAIAALCAARFWEKLHYLGLSGFYFNETLTGLKEWGAYKIAQRIKNKIKEKESLSVVSETNVSSTLSSTRESNIKNLFKIFYAISQTTQTKSLIHLLMKTILENAMASKAALILKTGEKFYIKSTIDFITKKIDICNFEIEQSSIVPSTLINYAINTKKGTAVDYPAKSGVFQFDPYFKKNRPASSMIIPILLEDQVTALLYLENEEVATLLDEETIQTLKLILTQASIIFKNVSLYENLKKSESDLKNAQKLTNIGSWSYNTENKKCHCSEEIYRIFDLKPYETAIDYEWILDHIHPDDKKIVIETTQNAIETLSYYDIEHRIITAKNKTKIVQQRAQISKENGVAVLKGTIQDITKQTHTKDLIYRLSQVVDQNPFSTIVTDLDGHIAYVNQQALEMTKYTEDELLGNKISILKSGVHTNKFYENFWYTIKEKKQSVQNTFINKRKDGQLIDCKSTIFPIFNLKNEIINFVAIQEDITEQNIKDRAFLMQTRQAQMGEMLSMIAHQWRQPLAIINAIISKERVKTILGSATTQSTTDTFDNIEFQVKYLSDTISDFKDFFKPDKEKVSTKSSIMVSKALALLEHSFKQKEIKITTTYLHDNSYKTYKNEVEQVILNLLKNAQDAFAEQNIEKPLIQITTDQKDNNAVIIVEDNAKGIDMNVIDTLFLPYISTKDQQNGIGLGLYMSKTIIENHCNGTINVQNTPNGAKFTITIPLKSDHD